MQPARYEVRSDATDGWGVYAARENRPVRLMGVPQVRMALGDANDLATLLNEFAAGHDRDLRRREARDAALNRSRSNNG